MAKKIFKGGTLLCPIPVIMATVGDFENANIITIAWTGIVNSDPPMTYISVRKERHSYDLLKKYKQFAINLVNVDLKTACDFCGVKSGRNVDKFAETKLKKEMVSEIETPIIAQSPLSLVCKVENELELGSHTMFLAKILSVYVDEKLIDAKGAIDLKKANLIAYSHGEYFELGKKLGKFGFSVEKKSTAKKRKVVGKKQLP